MVPHVKCHLLPGDWLSGRADMAPAISECTCGFGSFAVVEICESGGSALRRVSWFLVLRQDLQTICFSFERGALDRDMLNAGHAGRGERGAGSLRLVLAEALLTVFMVLGGQTHLKWGTASQRRRA